MDEVAGILIALGAMFFGFLVLAWACGDFSQSKASSKPEETTQERTPS